MAIRNRGGIATPDPFTLIDVSFAAPWKDIKGLTVRSAIVNPGIRTLVIIFAGQSNWTNITPTLYVPTNSSVIDVLNIYDGALYNINGPLIGGDYAGIITGPGHIGARVADKLVTGGQFDRVIIAPVAVGGTPVSYWGDATGPLYNRTPVALRRLAARGITPTTPGVTFALYWGQGEADQATSQTSYAASLSGMMANALANGFSGRFFIAQESWALGATSSAVRAAQAAAVNGTTVFSGGDLDTLGATNRTGDNTHFNDTGGAAAATIAYNAIHASGSPF